MVELEIKFRIEQFPILDSCFECQSTNRIIDEYYDTKDYNLVHNGVFIRKRGNRIDIKYLVSAEDNSVCNEYNINYQDFLPSNNELMVILDRLNFKFVSNSFDSFLDENCLTKLLEINKLRKKYKKDNITICFDEVEGLGEFIEVESVFEDLIEYHSAKEKLLEIIAKDISFIGAYSEEKTGYVELYLKKYNQAAYSRCLFKG